MFSYKFYVRKEKNNALTLRITNNRKKAELALGFKMDEDTLSDILSIAPRPENAALAYMLKVWRAQIQSVQVSLAASMRADEDVKVIRELVKVAIFGENKPEEEEAPKEPGGTFQAFFKQHIAKYDRRSTRKSNEYTLSCIRLASLYVASVA